jgi:hypothetical protein
LCIEVHDLAISKCVAGRERDLEFTAASPHNLRYLRSLPRTSVVWVCCGLTCRSPT